MSYLIHKVIKDIFEPYTTDPYENISLSFDTCISAATAVLIYDKIITMYKGNNLPYHNVAHIEYMLEIFNDNMYKNNSFNFFIGRENTKVIKLSILFHDIIYQQNSNENEELSAKFAHHIINDFMFDTGLADDVRDLILTTRYFNSNSKLNKKHRLFHYMNVLHDLDFAIFGDTYDRFKEYDKKIAEEYLKGYKLPKDRIGIYYEPRKKFLENTLIKTKEGKLFTTLSDLNEVAYTNINMILEERYQEF